ncbi:MAG: hypothetical protein LBL95_09070, partial [Deltaproteobacteria bacterium]|nr:hypothetical protein [Deltaproteobacteria bacterium]
MAPRGRWRLDRGTALPFPGVAMSGGAWENAGRPPVLAARVARTGRPRCRPRPGRQGDSLGQAPLGAGPGSRG